MSTYVISDIHGNYDAYKEMLKKIRFSEEDMLYILGDILDRGPQPIKVVLDLMERPNDPEKPLWEYELDELVWARPDYETPYLDE